MEEKENDKICSAVRRSCWRRDDVRKHIRASGQRCQESLEVPAVLDRGLVSSICPAEYLCRFQVMSDTTDVISRSSRRMCRRSWKGGHAEAWGGIYKTRWRGVCVSPSCCPTRVAAGPHRSWFRIESTFDSHPPRIRVHPLAPKKNLLKMSTHTKRKLPSILSFTNLSISPFPLSLNILLCSLVTPIHC